MQKAAFGLPFLALLLRAGNKKGSPETALLIRGKLSKKKR